MNSVAFDTLKLAQRLEAAGLAPKMAQDIAGAIAETVGDASITREHLDVALSELMAKVLRGAYRWAISPAFAEEKSGL